MLILNQFAGLWGKPVGDPNVVTWSAAISHASMSVTNGGLDIGRGTGSGWGICGVIAKALTAADKYSLDLVMVTKEPTAHDEFGINAVTDGGTVSSPGYLLSNIASRHYGIQPEGSIANGNVVTLDFNGPGAQLKIYINNSLNATISITTGVSYYFAYQGYEPGGLCRISAQVYAPKAGFTKLTA